MREWPIIFSAPMVRAILAGSKSQTRRLPTTMWDAVAMHHGPVGGTANLWVRERSRWGGWDPGGDYDTAAITYGADGKAEIRELAVTGWQKPYKSFDYETGKGWLGSIHMPRWASRITLKVQSIRLERPRRSRPRSAMPRRPFTRTGAATLRHSSASFRRATKA